METPPPSHEFDPRDVTPIPVLLVTPQGRIAWMNHATARLLGQNSGGLVGESFATLLSLGRRSIHTRAILRQHLRSAESFFFELPVRTARNADHWVGLLVQRTQTSGGRWAYVACLTDLQAMHQALDALNRRNSQLVAKARQSNAASEMKSEFLSGISNELRAPLGGMLEMSRVLLDTALDRDQRMVAEILQDSAQTIVSLVDDMVDFAKIESGQMETLALDFDVRLALDAVGSNLVADADSTGAAFRFRLHPSIPARLNGDPGRLRQVLLQIGRACLRSTSGQAGTLTLQGDPIEEAAFSVDLGFAFHFDPDDNIAAEPPALFAALANGDTRTSAAYGGLGMSLAIAHHLVALLGGRTDLQSAPNGGWILTVRLPFAKQAAAPASPLEEPVELKDRAVLALMGDDGFWTSLQDSARTFGVSVERVPNAPAALQTMRTQARSARPFAAVLVHLEMNGLDAARFARGARQHEEFDPIPLILVTSLGRSGDSAIAMDWGYSAYLSEPVTADLLRQTLEASIQQRRAQASAHGLARLVTRHSIAEEAKVRRCVLIADDNALDRLLMVSLLKKMGYASEVLANPDDILSRIAAGSGHVVVVSFAEDQPDPSDLVRRIRASADAFRNIPILALIAAEGDSGAPPRPSLDIDAIVDSRSELGDVCSAIEGLLLHGAVVPSKPAEGAPPTPAADSSASGFKMDPQLRADQVRRFVEGAEAAVAKTCSALKADDPIPGVEGIRALLECSRGVSEPWFVDLLTRLDHVFVCGRMDEATPLVFEMTQRVSPMLLALRAEMEGTREAA